MSRHDPAPSSAPRYPYEDPALPVDQRVADLAGRLGLEDKVGLLLHPQVLVGDPERPDGYGRTAAARRVRAGRVTHLLAQGTPADGRELAQWHNQVQRIALEHPLGIPVTLSSDPRHSAAGNPLTSNRAGGFSRWPEPIGLAATGSPELVEEFADIVRREYLATGLRLALHPQIDLATEPRWARISHTFGEDAELTCRLVRAFVRGLQTPRLGADSVAAMTKHFPGGGPQKDGLDPHFSDGREQIYPGGRFEHHLEPFIAAIEAGTAQIMPYYGMPVGTEWEEVGFAFNKGIITDLLRRRLGFDGVVCTDFGVITGYAEAFPAKAWGVEHLTREERVIKLLDAGVDQFGGEGDAELVLSLVKSGAVPESVLDDPVRRLLREKFRLGLFDDRRFVDEGAANAIVGCAAHRAAATRAQQRSLVLLKNESAGAGVPLLPLAKGITVYAEGVDPAAFDGLATVTETIADADVAVVRLHAPSYHDPAKGFLGSMHKGSLEFPQEQRQRITDLAARLPTVLDIHLERPAVLTGMLSAQAVIGSFGTDDRPFAEVLFAHGAEPEGALPFDLPSSMAAVEASRPDVPFDTAEPLFRFGWGLRYDRQEASPAGLLAGAAWITSGAPVPPPGERPGYEFRTFVDVVSGVRSAQLTITAHGVYEAFVNGVRVGDEELAPGLSSYHHTLYVQRHQVGAMLANGRNELRVVVSDGWFRGRCGASRVPDNFGTEIGLLARLDVATADGPVSVVTGTDWEAGVGAVVAADLMDGQRVDLRRADDISWGPVAACTDPHTGVRSRLAFSPAPPVRRVGEHRAVSIRRVGSDRQVVDFGVTVNGWVRLSALGPAGTTVTLTHGEWTGVDGDLDTAHLAYTAYRAPSPLPTGQVDQVVSRGRHGDVFEPRHTTHGFRYVAVDGLPHDLDPADIVAVEVRSDLTATGTFTCSDSRIARLHEIAVAAWRANSCDVPTDCPTRERWGYTGDYQVFVRSAAFLDDVEGFSRKWLRALADDQREDGCVTNVAPHCGVAASGIPISFDGSAGWGDAATIVPWEVYQAYGDPKILAECYPMMRRWVDYAAGAAAAGRHPSRSETRAEPAPHEQYLWDSGFHWGEWLEPGVGFDFHADQGIIATAYLHRSALITGRTAEVLGYRADAGRYLTLAERVRDAWQREFLRPDGGLTVPTQANHVRALAFDLVPEPLRPAVADALVALIRKADDHLTTGFLSTGLLLPVLAGTGHLDVAYTVLLQDSEPSWLTMVDRGATAIWESWNGVDADGHPHDSLTHYARGAVVTFLHEHVAGLRAEPGRRRFRIAPRPGGGLTSAGCTLRTRDGLVRTNWTLEDGTLTVRVEVPDGAEAIVELPDGAQYPAGPGSHTFTAVTSV